MKTLLLLFLPVLASWCSGPKAEDKSAFADNVKTENTIRSDSNSEKAFKKIRLHFKTPGQYYDKIEFWDESSRQLIKIVDLEQLNPFNNLPYKEIGISYGSKKYDLRGVKKNKLSKSIGDWHTSESIADKTPVAADGQILVFDGTTMEHFTVAAYNLYLTNKNNQVIAIIGEYFVFNDHGEVVSRIKNNQAGSAPIVTQDGKYLAVKYGGTYGECGSGHLPEGLLFFDLESNQKILNYQRNEYWNNEISLGEAYNKILAADYIGGTVHPNRYWVFDLDSCKVYYTEIYGKKPENRPVWQKDGAIYTQEGSRRKFFFHKDFKIENLKIENK
jgi:hypothetical protein